MTRNTVAVILLGGWLLMIPPPTNKGGNVDLDAPIGTWLQYAAYKRQEECVQALFNARNNAIDETTSAAVSAESKKHVQFGRCVPAQDIAPPTTAAPK